MTLAAPRTRARLAVLPALVLTVLTVLGVAAAPATAAPAPSAPPAEVSASLISYVGYVNGAHQVFTMRSDGSQKTQVTRNTTGTKKCDPMLSPSGKELAYASNNGRMWVHVLGAAEAVDIAPKAPEGVEYVGGRRPTWSADGNTVVFHFSTDTEGVTPEADRTFDLWMVNRTAGTWGEPRRITAFGKGQSALHARYNVTPTSDPASADWLSYSFRASPTASYVLRVVQAPAATSAAAPGSGLVGQTLPTGSSALLSTWSMSGARIAYVSGCSAAVRIVDVTRGGTSWGVSNDRAVAQSGGCGLSWSRSDENRLTYADTGRIYAKDVFSGARAVTLGTGSMPSW